MKVIFTTTLDVRFHRYQGGVVWELLAPLVVIIDPHADTQRIIRVPPGSMTDFASVPRLPFVYMSYANKVHLESVLHDHLYTVGGNVEDFNFANRVFLDAMLCNSVQDGELSEADAHSMFNAVSMFGRDHFNFVA